MEKELTQAYVLKKNKDKLKQIAKEKGLSFTALINIIIDDYLKKEGR